MLLGGSSGSRVSHGALGPAEEQGQPGAAGAGRQGHPLAPLASSGTTTSVLESQREAVSDMEHGADLSQL